MIATSAPHRPPLSPTRCSPIATGAPFTLGNDKSVVVALSIDADGNLTNTITNSAGYQLVLKDNSTSEISKVSFEKDGSQFRNRKRRFSLKSEITELLNSIHALTSMVMAPQPSSSKTNCSTARKQCTALKALLRNRRTSPLRQRTRCQSR